MVSCWPSLSYNVGTGILITGTSGIAWFVAGVAADRKIGTRRMSSSIVVFSS